MQIAIPRVPPKALIATVMYQVMVGSVGVEVAKVEDGVRGGVAVVDNASTPK